MPPTIASPARPSRKIAPTLPNATIRARVADLKPLDVLDVFAREVPGAEPAREELIRLLKAGQRPYPVVVSGMTVLFGQELVRAAQAAGVESVGVSECVSSGILLKADFGLMAAGLHLRAVLDRPQQDPFETRLLGAKVYEVLVLNREHHRLRGVPAEQKKKRPEQRQALIKEEFGRAQRSLERDVVLRHLPPDLRDAVRHGQLPERFIEPAAKLPAADQKRLADRLASETTFADLEEEFFGASGTRRKTDRGAARAIRASIHMLVEEFRGREGRFALRDSDRPAARQVIAYLSGCLAAPPPEATLGDVVDEAVEELGRRTPHGRRDASAAAGSAKGDRA